VVLRVLRAGGRQILLVLGGISGTGAAVAVLAPVEDESGQAERRRRAGAVVAGAARATADAGAAADARVVSRCAAARVDAGNRCRRRAPGGDDRRGQVGPPRENVLAHACHICSAGSTRVRAQPTGFTRYRGGTKAPGVAPRF